MIFVLQGHPVIFYFSFKILIEKKQSDYWKTSTRQNLFGNLAITHSMQHSLFQTVKKRHQLKKKNADQMHVMKYS